MADVRSRIDILFDGAERECAGIFARIAKNEELETARVLALFRRHEVALRHFSPSNGYGYDDTGRDTLEKIYADFFGTEAAIVRPHIVSGTAALSLCLFGLLRPGDHLLSVTGLPYDTLQTVIGLSGDAPGSLREMNVNYSQVDLKDGKLDVPAICAALRPDTRVVMLQRSRGYDWRPSLLPSEMREAIEKIHYFRPDTLVMVDNCYGEMICPEEPTHVGADLCVGSLIKNIGGGLAPTGGYICGSKAAIERIAARMTAPGIGREEGSYAADYRPFYQGLFMAPHTVAQALKVSVLAARVFERLGMKTTPRFDENRSDIIQAIELKNHERLIAFCQGIQGASPVDANAVPEPWDMPGYADQVIMAAGTFVAGASIELSADGPMREPYIAYLQGGLTYAHGKIALKETVRSLAAKGLL